MPGAPIARSAFTGAYLGRNVGPELFYTLPLLTPSVATQNIIPKTVNLNRPLEGFILKWSGRIVLGTANISGIASEAPMTLIDRIQIRGTFKGQAFTPIDITGATAFNWARLFGIRGSSCYINNTRLAEPSVPFQQVGATFGNTGTYDIEMYFYIPVYPLVSPSMRGAAMLPFCWHSEDWNDTLQIQINTGQNSSLGNVGTTTFTYTAFGSASGSPQIEIFTRYMLNGGLRRGVSTYETACVLRTEQQITSGVTALSTAFRMWQLQKQKTSNVLVKAGQNFSANANVFADLRDTLLDVTQIQVDNRPIRNNQDNGAFKEHAGLQFNTILPEGYLLLPFCDSQNPRSALRADLEGVVPRGAQFEIVTNILEANAQNCVNVIQEQIIAKDSDPWWLGTR